MMSISTKKMPLIVLYTYIYYIYIFLTIDIDTLPYLTADNCIDITGNLPVLPVMMSHDDTSGKADDSSLNSLLC